MSYDPIGGNSLGTWLENGLARMKHPHRPIFTRAQRRAALQAQRKLHRHKRAVALEKKFAWMGARPVRAEMQRHAA